MKMAWIIVAGLAVGAGAGVGLLPDAPHMEQAAPANEARSADVFEIDAGHSSALFKISHLGVSNFYGRFNGIKGSFSLNADSPEASTIRVEIDAATVDTNSDARDGHLKSPDFFNAGQFPTMSFTSKTVTKGSEAGAFDVVGDLTANGKTKEISIKVVQTGEATLPKFGHRAGMETSVVIKRADFGMNYMPDLLGAEVTLTVSLEGVAK